MKDNINFLYSQLIDKFVSWANTCDDIRTVLIVGSRARSNVPADQWSDLDLVIVTTNPEYYILDTKWIDKIAQPLITFIEKSAVGGGKERRVLFENGLDVDFAIFSVEDFKQIISTSEVLSVLSRGMKILVDKEGIMRELRIVSKEKMPCLLSQNDFINLVNDFWYHAVWTAKKLLRGEVWTAKSCLDGYMKNQLLCLLECHAKTMHGIEYDTWHEGRFLDDWVDSRILNEVKDAFAYYDKNDIKRALFVTMNLFECLGIEIAEKLEYCYPQLANDKAMEMVKNLLEEGSGL